jgi:hypothetical protein
MHITIKADREVESRARRDRERRDERRETRARRESKKTRKQKKKEETFWELSELRRKMVKPENF